MTDPLLHRPVLVVDDHELNVVLLVDTLEAAGFTRISWTTDSREVEEMVARDEPDLVLLDLMMPFVDGFEVMAAIRRRLEDPPPVLVLTGDASGEAKRRALAEGARDFLTKPFDPDEVVLRARNLLESRTLNRALREQNATLERCVAERTAELATAWEREREAAERLRDLDRLKDAFLAGVSSDLRTPLTVLTGGVKTLRRGNDRLDDASRAKILDSLARASEQLDGLLRDVLDLDRLRRGLLEPVFQPIEVDRLVETVLGRAEARMDARAVHRDLVACRGWVDASTVERVVETLLANADRHTPPGTNVWVRLRPCDAGVEIVVEDDGPGLSDAVREAAFEPLRQDEAEVDRPGLGVGLALVASLAKVHRGRVWAEPRPGGGTSFHVVLATASEPRPKQAVGASR